MIEDKYIDLFDPKLKINEDILYYRKLKFQGKKFTLFIKKRDINKYNNLYYINIRQIKIHTIDDNRSFKTRIYICNSKIKFDKKINFIFIGNTFLII